MYLQHPVQVSKDCAILATLTVTKCWRGTKYKPITNYKLRQPQIPTRLFNVQSLVGGRTMWQSQFLTCIAQWHRFALRQSHFESNCTAETAHQI